MIKYVIIKNELTVMAGKKLLFYIIVTVFIIGGAVYIAFYYDQTATPNETDRTNEDILKDIGERTDEDIRDDIGNNRLDEDILKDIPPY